MLYWYENRTESFRVGFSINKKVGNAVVRNRLKRRLKACFLALIPQLSNQQQDFVIVCRKGSGDATFSELQTDVMKLLRRAKFMI